VIEQRPGGRGEAHTRTDAELQVAWRPVAGDLDDAEAVGYCRTRHHADVDTGRHHPNVRLAGRHCLKDRRARLLFQADPDTRLFAQLIALVLANTVTWLFRPLA